MQIPISIAATYGRPSSRVNSYKDLEEGTSLTTRRNPGTYPEWDLGLQIVPEEDEHKFDFDLLDATKIIPEELVPVRRVGRLVLNRNPDNFFAETEQVAYCTAHLVPGIEASNDPLLQVLLLSHAPDI